MCNKRTEKDRKASKKAKKIFKINYNLIFSSKLAMYKNFIKML